MAVGHLQFFLITLFCGGCKESFHWSAWTDDITSPNRCSAVKTTSLCTTTSPSLWLINVTELIEGKLLFDSRFLSLISTADLMEAQQVWLRAVVQGATLWGTQRAGGVRSCRLMDYSDICFIHSSTTLLQQPHCAPQKCSSSHGEARLPINKMVTMQNPDKIWMLFILWKWQMGPKRWGGFTIVRGWCQEGFQSDQLKRS